MERQAWAPVRILDRIAGFGVWIGGICLLVSSSLIAADLLLRKFAGWSMGGADEIAGYVLAIVSAWAFPVTLLRRSHIRVDVLYTHMSQPVRIALDLFAMACLALFVGVLTFHAWQALLDSILFKSVSNTPLQVPLWIPQSLWFAGYVFFLVTTVMLFVGSLWLLFRNRRRDISRLIGIHSVEEEIIEEVGTDDMMFATER